MLEGHAPALLTRDLLRGWNHPVLTVFGDEETRALLGSVALETFGLAVDPVNQRLVSVPGLLMTYPAE